MGSSSSQSSLSSCREIVCNNQFFLLILKLWVEMTIGQGNVIFTSRSGFSEIVLFVKHNLSTTKLMITSTRITFHYQVGSWLLEP